MATMTVAQFPAANAALELVTREVPEQGAGQVLLRVRACGICHSDRFVQGGAFPGLRLPRVPGHEVAAVVERVGPGVRPWQPATGSASAGTAGTASCATRAASATSSP